MKLPPLTRGVILSRYKRFLADIRLDSGETVTAHCANTGAMTGCWEPGAPAQLSASTNPQRKLAWTLERIDMGMGWIGVNTNRVNQIIASFISAGDIASLAGYQTLKREPAYNVSGHGKSRLDLLLTSPGKPDCYIEVKNTTLFDDNTIRFPDAVTTRGKKHLELLQHAASEGHRSIILFAINRPEGNQFRAAREIDPNYCEALSMAYAAGVEIIPFRIAHSDDSVEPGGVIPYLID